ncbi:predicted protein [Sclerotinia sclerotiorum 1980 UF-70]|uniref:Uncharacterized protein n=1 Tax=Sclerotinia sclerotiorum (strain ATCC 18683 / 1980 / Ss-1) TaxID=665079 RepID=A7EZC3_SCLS1|nr:predicted protein [Sclerotinia sclerotiorum 1980 UF-70]EDN94815.1 predicted protein [Sclerotinia sclerotiorum 1980 UF-70]
MWTGDSIPIPGYLSGETIGSQPSNGFTNWICFDNGMEKARYHQLDCRASVRCHILSFVMGMEFFYQFGLKETVGNLIGSSHQIVLGIGESIFSVQFYERVQCIFSDATYPRDVMCVEGISFGIVKFINGEAQTRLSMYCGCSKPFGPF